MIYKDKIKICSLINFFIFLIFFRMKAIYQYKALLSKIDDRINNKNESLLEAIKALDEKILKEDSMKLHK